jgi:hypothetical protein
MLRFVNDYGINNNLKPIYLPIKGIWRLFYVSTRDIKCNEELSIDYGKGYWRYKI